jgi:Chlorophyllase enzyme
MRTYAVRLVTALTALMYALVPAAAAHADTSYHPAGAIEAKFFQPGPFAVDARFGFGCCDSTGAKYDIWYPADLGTARHPIITWGNGTVAVPRQYDYLLAHLASWGFVVIATENQSTGSGVDIAGAARYLIDRAADSASIFHNRLDPDAVGAMGHSQGATGVLNAMALSGGLIKTAIPIELPMQALCFAGSCAEPAKLRSGSVFFVNGSGDGFISPSTPWLPLPGLQSNRQYYDATSRTVTKSWGTLIGPNHNDVQGRTDCSGVSSGCTTGVYGYLGYPTAWMMGQLWGDMAACAAFTPGPGEFFRPNPNWTNQVGTVAR